MGKYVTETGLNKRTFDDLVTYYTGVFRSVFGDDVDLNPEQATGALLDYLASTDAETWDTVQDTYTANDVRNAVGVSLDNNTGALINVLRQDATKGQVHNVVFFGDQGTIITAGKRVRNSTTVDADRVTFDVDSDVTIDSAAAREAWYSMDLDDINPTVYSVDIDAQVYSVNGIYASEESVISDLADVINNEAPQKHVAELNFDDNGDPILRVWHSSSIPEDASDTTFVIGATVNTEVESFGSPGNVTALLEGFVAIDSGFISEIATGVNGWSRVYNTDPKIPGTGTGVELDPAYRKRLQQNITGAGFATENAIRRVVLNDVDAVNACIVSSNRTMTALPAPSPTNGQAPKSFQTYVDGIGVISGDITEEQQELGEAIFKAAPAGIEIFGTEGPIVVEDDDGEDQNVFYSIVQGVSMDVEVTRSKYEEFNPYPVDGDDQIKNALVSFARDNWVLDRDVVPSSLITPIYLSVLGVGTVVVTARVNGSGNPFSADIIPVNSASIAILEFANITVLDA